jgi:hypothetical protein
MVSRRWACVVAVAVVFAGLTNAQALVHLCFVGQEPPASVHLTDGIDHHHDQAPTGDHDDVDVDLPDEALAKTVKYDLAAIAPPLGSAFAIDRQSSTVCALSEATPAVPEPLYSHPQLRAPPR